MTNKENINELEALCSQFDIPHTGTAVGSNGMYITAACH